MIFQTGVLFSESSGRWNEKVKKILNDSVALEIMKTDTLDNDDFSLLQQLSKSSFFIYCTTSC